MTPTELAAANARNGIGGVYFGQLTPMQLGYQNAIRDISIGIDDIIPPITLPPGIGIGTGGRGGVGVGGAGVGGAGTGTGTGASAGAKGLSSTAAKLMADQIANATSSTASGVGTPNQVPTPTFLEAFPNINLNLPNTSSDIFQKLSTIAMGMIPLLSGTNDVYQRAYNWEILLPGISVIMPQTIGKFVQGVSFGEYNMNDVAKMRYGAETRGHAGVMDIPKVTLKMLKPVPDLVYTYLMMWKTFIVDAAGFYFPKSNYALTGYVLMFDTAGNTVGTYKLINMFPTSFPAHNLSYGDDNVMSYEIEFNVDRIEYI